MMNAGEKDLLRIFHRVHGKKGFTGSISLEVIVDDDIPLYEVRVLKHNKICWTATREDLVFDLLTMKTMAMADKQKGSLNENVSRETSCYVIDDSLIEDLVYARESLQRHFESGSNNVNRFYPENFSHITRPFDKLLKIVA